MDAHISAMDAEPDGDLMLCINDGIAWQADMTITAKYDKAYFDKYVGYEGSDIAKRINRARVSFVEPFVRRLSILDIGIGSGEFIKSRPNTRGMDVNPVAIDWLKERGRMAENFNSFIGFTFWDVIEHIPRPADYFDGIPASSFVFAAMPIFADLRRIRESKHYRPGEHLYYFTEWGFVNWMGLHSFDWLQTSNVESVVGREDILSFAFLKVAG